MDSRAENLIIGILKQMVSKPDELSIVRSIDARGVLLTLTSNPDDAGLIIGRQGDTLNSIRQLARLIGYKDKETVFVVYKDPKGEYLK